MPAQRMAYKFAGKAPEPFDRNRLRLPPAAAAHARYIAWREAIELAAAQRIPLGELLLYKGLLEEAEPPSAGLSRTGAALAYLGGQSPASVWRHVAGLERRRWLKREPRKTRVAGGRIRQLPNRYQLRRLRAAQRYVLRRQRWITQALNPASSPPDSHCESHPDSSAFGALISKKESGPDVVGPCKTQPTPPPRPPPDG